MEKNTKGEPLEKNTKLIERVLKGMISLGKGGDGFEESFFKVKEDYEALGENEREFLFRYLVERVEIAKNEVKPVLESLTKCDQTDPHWPGLLAEFRKKSYSPRLKIFRAISRSPGGLKFLLDFRGDLLSVRRRSQFNLEPLDLDISFLFEMWFQEGFLYLEEITLDSSYRQIELIKNRDLVHPMVSIEEMGQRLGKDMKCFALYHRLLPYEPVVFIEVALTEGIAGNVDQIMVLGDEKEKGRVRVDTAIFYSINNTQNGLTGLGLGKMLIGKVMDYIREENEKVRNFATLSPLPGLWQGYLMPILKGEDTEFKLKKKDVISFFPKKAVTMVLERAGISDTDEFNSALLLLLSDPSWPHDEGLSKELHDPLVKIVYHYIAAEKNLQGKPLNPVAGFHLGNGAKVAQKYIRFLGNPSGRGLKESCGFMVNYVYTTSWLSQARRSFRWFDRMEIRGIFGRTF